MKREAGAFLKALRGRRSQRQWARRLGYRGNPITDWERGKRFPTAQETLRAATLAGIDVEESFRRFMPALPIARASAGFDLASWLSALRGRSSLVEIGARSGLSRFSVARFLSGRARPRLPHFLRLVDALTGRLPEWVAAFVPIELVPSLTGRFHAADAARRIAFEVPWSEAVLRVLETQTYRRRRRHVRGSVAACLDVSREQEAECLRRLTEADIVEYRAGKFHVRRGNTVDTQGGQQALLNLKRHWATVAATRLAAPQDEDFFAYNVVSLSRAALGRAREILRGAFRELRSLVAASNPEEVAALVNLQLVTFLPRTG
jgi:hypothetical protein